MDTNEALDQMIHDLGQIGNETGWVEAILFGDLMKDLWIIEENQRWSKLAFSATRDLTGPATGSRSHGTIYSSASSGSPSKDAETSQLRGR